MVGEGSFTSFRSVQTFSQTINYVEFSLRFRSGGAAQFGKKVFCKFSVMHNFKTHQRVGIVTQIACQRNLDLVTHETLVYEGFKSCP